MKSPLSLLLVAVVMATLGAAAAKADPEDTYRQYPERQHQPRFEGDKHANRGDDYHEHRPEQHGREFDRARWNDYRENRPERRWRGFD